MTECDQSQSSITIRRVSLDTVFGLRRTLLLAGNPDLLVMRPRDYRPDSRHLGAFRVEQCLGIFSAELHRRSGDPAKSYRFRSLAVISSAQRAGVGSMLCLEMASVLHNEGAERIWGTPRASALSFYERLGIHRTGGRLPYEGNPNHLREVVQIDRADLELVLQSAGLLPTPTAEQTQQTDLRLGASYL